MSGRRGLISSVLLLGGGQGLVQALMFGRNIVLARLLGPSEMGVAAALVIMASLLEMVSNLSSDKLLMQAEDGHSPRLQATAQFMQSIRGAFQSVALMLLAGPAAALFHAPEAAAAFRLLALSPLLRGLEHLDPRRLQREGRFARSVLVDVLPQAISLLVALAAGLHLASHRAALWAILAQSASSLVLTHLLAAQAYRWAWDRSHARRFLSFGTPLLFNGILLFAIVQGERLIVGSAYGPELLGNYSVAFMVGFAPTMMLANIATSLLLPRFSAALRAGSRWHETYSGATVSLAAVAMAAGIGLITLGRPIIVMIFGQPYALAGSLVGVLMAAQAIRLLRIAPTLAAMAHADTQNTLWSNLLRCLSLAPAIYAALHGADVLWVGAWGALGEGAALLLSTRRLQRRQGQDVAWTLWPSAVAIFGLAGASVWARLFHGWWELIAGAVLVMAFTGFGLLLTLPGGRRRPAFSLTLPVKAAQA